MMDTVTAREQLRLDVVCLANARLALVEADDAAEDAAVRLRKAAPNEYTAQLDAEAFAKGLREEVEGLELSVRWRAALLAKGDLPLGVGHRNIKRVEYDAAEAVEWCVRTGETQLLSVDAKRYGDLLKSGATSAPGRVVEEVKVTIASDLSSYLEES